MFWTPSAGAFQDYGDDGLYKDQWGGMDSLHQLYKEDRGTKLNVKAESWQDRETLTWPLVLAAGVQTVKVTFANDFWDEATRQEGAIFIDRLVILDAQGRQVKSVEFEDLEPPVKANGGRCGRMSRNPATGREDHIRLSSSNRLCVWRIDVEVPALDVYTTEVIAWSNGYHEQYRPDGYGRLVVSANGYEEGDTWYRDMRSPGFSDEQVPKGQDSLQWLAQQVVKDRRFAEATVKFWVAGDHGKRSRGAAGGGGRCGLRGTTACRQCPERGGEAAGAWFSAGVPWRAGVQPQGSVGGDGALEMVPCRRAVRFWIRYAG